jgi:hypothetical protein
LRAVKSDAGYPNEPFSFRGGNLFLPHLRPSFRNCVVAESLEPFELATARSTVVATAVEMSFSHGPEWKALIIKYIGTIPTSGDASCAAEQSIPGMFRS